MLTLTRCGPGSPTACLRRQFLWGIVPFLVKINHAYTLSAPGACAVCKKAPRPGPAAAAFISAISALGHCAAPGAAKQLVPCRLSLLAEGARKILYRAPPGKKTAAVELMVAFQHMHARARVRRGAATAACRVFRCAVGWRGERLEADRAAHLGLSAHLDKKLG